MQKLGGAKDKLGLRVHGLIVGSPDKKRADPAVLRSLCTNYLPSGKVELCLSEFEGWASVQVGWGAWGWGGGAAVEVNEGGRGWALVLVHFGASYLCRQVYGAGRLCFSGFEG